MMYSPILLTSSTSDLSRLRMSASIAWRSPAVRPMMSASEVGDVIELTWFITRDYTFHRPTRRCRLLHASSGADSSCHPDLALPSRGRIPGSAVLGAAACGQPWALGG